MATKKPTDLITEKEFGAWLDSKRAPGETIEAFAKRLGTTRQTLSSVINGQRQPGLDLSPKLKKLGYVKSERFHRVTV